MGFGGEGLSVSIDDGVWMTRVLVLGLCPVVVLSARGMVPRGWPDSKNVTFDNGRGVPVDERCELTAKQNCSVFHRPGRGVRVAGQADVRHQARAGQGSFFGGVWQDDGVQDDGDGRGETGFWTPIADGCTLEVL